MQTTGAGIDKTISDIGSLNLGNGTGSASNYTLSGGNHIIEVNPRTTVALGSRFYDGTTVVNGSAFSTFSNTVGSDAVTVSGIGSVGSAGVGSKSVSIGSLSSAHPNYILNGASLTITKKPLNLFGSRVPEDDSFSLDVFASELSLGTVSGETLALSGAGTIADALPGTVQSISLGTLSFSDGTGSASNYTFSGGSFLMILKHKLTIPQRVRNILKKGRSGRNLILLPTKTTHRNVPAVAEKISISTPDQSITVKPCILQNGLCS